MNLRSLFLTSLLIFLVGCASTNSVDKGRKKKADIYYTYGTQMLIDKNYTKALSHLLKAQEQDPSDPRIQINLGMAYYFKGKKRNALVHLKKALELDESNSDARTNIASVYFSMGEIKKAKELYLSVLEDLTYERSYRTYFNLGLISIREKNQPQAIKYFDKSLQVEPAYCPANYQLGLLQKAQYRYQEAAENFEFASQGHCEKRPEPHLEQALTYIDLKKYSKARSKLNLIVKNFKDTRQSKVAKQKLQQLTILEKRKERFEQISKQQQFSTETPNF